MPYREDDEFMAYVGHLIEKPSVQRLKGITHHIHSNRLEHSINVSYTSYKIWLECPQYSTRCSSA